MKEDGRFELNNLNLKSWAGDTVSLQVLIEPKSEWMASWSVVNGITFRVKK